MQHNRNHNPAYAPIPTVRIALVGLGYRGKATLERYSHIEGAYFSLLCERGEEDLQAGSGILTRTQKESFRTILGEDGWKEACEADDVDLVYLCTPWSTHAPMAIYAMEHGKHVAVEIPVAQTLEECQMLIETAHRTKRHCMMLENCCYDTFHLGVTEMVRAGMIGELTHLEGAYIHDIRDHSNIAEYCPPSGNPYPTHGLGPLCQLLNLDGTNPLVEIVSTHSRFHICKSLIVAEKGQTIELTLDVTTPRPYSRAQVVCGTKGFIQKYPIPTVQLDGRTPLIGPEAETYVEQFIPKHYKKIISEGKAKGVANIMNYLMDYRLIHCLHEGLPMDISIEEAAEWSSITALSTGDAKEHFVHRLIP